MGRKVKRNAGVDVHESNLEYAIVDTSDNVVAEKKFLNDAKGHLLLIQWLRAHKTYRVGMESTGIYWKAMAQALDSHGIKVHVGNAEAMKNVPGAKTDKLDARRIARLLRDGYIPESNVLLKNDDDFRCVVRSRLRLVQQKVSVKNRISALVVRCGIKIRASDKFGKFGLKVLKAISAGEPLDDIFTGPQTKKLGYSKEEYLALLEMYITDTIRTQLALWLDCLHDVEMRILEVEKQIMELIRSDTRRIQYLRIIESMPGFRDIASALVISEIGDIHSFPTERKFCAYAGLVPTVYQSGERMEDGHVVKKSFMGRLRRRSNKRLKSIFVMAANVVIRQANSPLVQPLQDFYHRIRRRNHGRYAKQKALMALAHKLARILWTMLTKEELYHGQDGVVKNIIHRKTQSAPLTNTYEPILQKVMKALIDEKPSVVLSQPIAGG